HAKILRLSRSAGVELLRPEGLKLHRIGSGTRRDLDETTRLVEVAVMVASGFGHEVHGMTASDRLAPDAQLRHKRFPPDAATTAPRRLFRLRSRPRGAARRGSFAGVSLGRLPSCAKPWLGRCRGRRRERASGLPRAPRGFVVDWTLRRKPT